VNVLELPFPPSVNTYWRHPTNGRLAGRHLISEKGREYRQAVIAEAGRYQLPKMQGKLSVHIDAFPPDNRRRDLDNMMKGLLDGLVHAQVIEDDSQIDKLSIERGVVCKGGRVRVYVSEYRSEA
jgi:crossover junction endodeoxyribonuclease RusA